MENNKDIDYDRFFYCISMLCNGMPIHPKLKKDYLSNKDNISLIQDHVGEHCILTFNYNFPTMAIIEMAEAYAKYRE